MEDKIEYCINNLNREKIFKEIVKETKITDIKICNNQIKFCVNKKYQKKVDKILEKKNAKIINKKIIGGINYLKNVFFKLEVAIPIILFIFFLIISNNYILRFEIQGIEQINKNEIMQIIKQNDINNFTLKNKINLKQLENNILKVDKVSLVSATIKGNTLIINIKEKVHNPEYEEKDSFLPLVSKYNGIVTKINVTQGTPLVKVGQTIKVGQELIAPYVIDTSGETRGVYAKGEVFADVFFSESFEVNSAEIKYSPTGKVIQNRQIFVGSVKIFDANIECKFKEYKTEVKEQILNGALLPLKIVETIYYEQNAEVIEDYFEKNKEQILEDCKQKTRQLIPNYDIIKDEYYDITTLAGINRITYTYLVELEITKT